MAQTRHLSFVLDDNVTSSHILMDVSANNQGFHICDLL